MPRPIHFEIHAADPERCKGFYSALFGWTFTEPPGMAGYHLISTGSPGEPGIDGGMVRRMGDNPDSKDPTPVIAYVCTVGVDDVDGHVAKALSLGGGVAVPKMAIPGVGWLAYVKDTESNIVGLMHSDPTAA
ncbi:MAG: VOC family protein [Phenylobacterium sp.]|nr:MAG: VOC family protein [Phenylobacterium sp.]